MGRATVVNFFTVAGLVLVLVGLFARNDGTRAGDTAGFILLMIGGIWAALGVGLRLLYAAMARRAKAEHELFETGTKATAVVDGVQPTGMVLNNINTQIVLSLRVQPRFEPEFAYRRRIFVPFNGVPRVGDMLDVAYDPEDKSKVALATDWSNNTGGGRLLLLRRAGDAADSAYQTGQTAPSSESDADRVLEQLERLHRLKREGALTESEYELQKARIFSEQAT